MQKLKLSIVARSLCVALSLCVFGVLPALAQTQPGAAPAAAPAVTAPAATAEPAPAAPASDMPPPPPCFPACREGFMCGDAGQCISACNPGCGAGERCTAQGQCVIDAQVTPVAPPEYAPPPPPEKPAPPPEEGVETHDGVMLRFTIGIGGGSMTETFDNPPLGIPDEGVASGGGWMGAIDIGAGITDELTIHGRIGLLELVAPKITADGDETDPPYGVSMLAVLIGPGLTYNIMPINLYITAVGGLNIINYSYDENDSDFDEDDRDQPTAGFGLNLDVGKEWWVTPQTGIGVAGRFWWGTGGAEYDDATLSGVLESERSLIAFGIVFSVTHQ